MYHEALWWKETLQQCLNNTTCSVDIKHKVVHAGHWHWLRGEGSKANLLERERKKKMERDKREKERSEIYRDTPTNPPSPPSAVSVVSQYKYGAGRDWTGRAADQNWKVLRRSKVGLKTTLYLIADPFGVLLGRRETEGVGWTLLHCRCQATPAIPSEATGGTARHRTAPHGKARQGKARKLLNRQA